MAAVAAKAARDVVIVGGGVVGMSAAFHLAERAAGALRVTVVERDPTYARASSALSASGLRLQFSTAANVQMSQYGAAFVRDGARLAVPGGDVPDMQFREQGYLFLASSAEGEAILRANTAVQHACGAGTELLAPAELKARYPWLEVGDVALGALGARDEGWFDPHSLLQALRAKAVSLGVSVVADSVVGVEREGARVTGVQLVGGERLAAGFVVNAAGAWAAEVAAMAGLGGSLPVAARKRCVFHFACPDRSVGNAPLLVDPSGVYFRPEGEGAFICGVSPPADQDPDCAGDDPLHPDHALFEDTIWPALAERVPAFEELRLNSAWAGFYEYNTVDQNAIIGPHPDAPNLLLANGFSGHGVQQAPAAGRAVAELVLGGQFETLDLSMFGLGREPVVEVNVV